MEPNKPKTKPYYDKNLVKAIPIVDVCHALGIETVSKGDKTWCKLRNERTPSTLLHTEPSKNSYYDFGTGEHGNVIDLVETVNKMDFGSAITFLGELFDIEPENNQKRTKSFDLSNTEYKLIGIHGDLATKNFIFNIERTSVEQMAEISRKYSMSMSDLRKKHPKTYERVLRQKAIPYVKHLRNSYYFDVYCEYRSAQQYNSIDLFYRTAESRKHFDSVIKQLQSAERALCKAAKGTSLHVHGAGEYDPITDVVKIINGEITPELGSMDYIGIQKEAKLQNTEVKFYKTGLSQYFSVAEKLSSYTTSGFLTTDDCVVIRYLARDKAALQPIFDSISERGKRDLKQMICDAESVCNNQDNQHKPENRLPANIGENERG